MEKPEAILFDFGDTLLCDLKFNPLAGNARLLEFAETPGRIRPEDIQEVANALERQIRPLREAGMLELTCQSFQRILYDRLKLTFRLSSAAMEMEFWQAAVTYTPEAGVRAALETLKSYDLKMGVVSNNAFSGAILEWELEKHHLRPAFDFVLSSADHGIGKPHPLIFSIATSRLDLPPSAVWYVGDMLSYDVEGSKQAGLWSIWYNRQKQKSEGIQPDAEVSSWSEFIALVQGYLR